MLRVGAARLTDAWRRYTPISQTRITCMGSVIKKRRKKMSKHKYRKRLKANRHKRKK